MDLSREKPFRLGSAYVTPTLLRVAWSEQEETLQPRVMEVLVVLARAGGEVVSRDALIAECWGQRIATDDAVNRIVAKLRTVANLCGAFDIETVSKIGFRLVEQGAAAEGQSPKTVVAAVIRRRPRALVATAGAALVLAVGGVIWGLQAGVSTRLPEIEVEPFAVTGTGLPNTLAADVREEMLTTFPRGSSEIALKATDPGQRPTTFRLRGRIEANGDLVNVYARLEPPDGSHILWSNHYEVPLARAQPAVLSRKVISTVACIMHIYQGPGAPGLSSPAMAPWTDMCTDNSSDRRDRLREIAALRQTVSIAPDFARAQAKLAEFLAGPAETSSPSEKKAMIDEGLAAAARAERLAPKQGESYEAEAVLRWDTDPVRAEQLLIKAVQFGTVGEIGRQTYTQLLERVGRFDDALEQHHRVLAAQPNTLEENGLIARDLAAKGDYDGAKQALTQAERVGTNPAYAQFRLQFAIWFHDWPTARANAGAVTGGSMNALIPAYIDALASGDKAKINTAGALFESLAADAENLRPLTADALALTGRPKAALAAVGRLVDRDGRDRLRQVYTPPFAEARRTPEFEALATRYGLMDYWKRSGHEPDFCKASDAPAFCQRLAG
jgi:DNA-binding winged helix-turn-helix (wHTH) protein